MKKINIFTFVIALLSFCASHAGQERENEPAWVSKMQTATAALLLVAGPSLIVETIVCDANNPGLLIAIGGICTFFGSAHLISEYGNHCSRRNRQVFVADRDAQIERPRSPISVVDIETQD